MNVSTVRSRHFATPAAARLLPFALLLVSMVWPLLLVSSSRPASVPVPAVWQPAMPPDWPTNVPTEGNIVHFDRGTGLLAIAVPDGVSVRLVADADSVRLIRANQPLVADATIPRADLRGVRLHGGDQSTLALSGFALPHAFAVQSDSPLVVDGPLTTGDLSLTAPSLTIRSALTAPRIGLTSTGLVDIAPGVLLRAQHATDGGQVVVAARTLMQTGHIQADGVRGGGVQVAVDYLIQQGTVSASGATGGVIALHARRSYQDTTQALTEASGRTGAGGTLTLSVDDTGSLFSSGRLVVGGTSGGTLTLHGGTVALLDALLDASGRAAVGGLIQITAPHTITQRGTLRATGAQGGGHVAVLTPATLNWGGHVDASAVRGPAGQVQLDPKSVIIQNAPTGVFPQYDLIDPNPNTGNQFGTAVTALSTGNVVIAAPFDDAGATDAGSVYLFNATTGALLSTLTGSNANDRVGLDGTTALANGNYVVQSSRWNNGATSQAGAVTWSNGVSGVAGTVSNANSLVGATNADRLGSSGVVALPNGHYVVRSPFWHLNALVYPGAVTWGNGTTGIRGMISSANSLIGSTINDRVGIDPITVLTNGNYVIPSTGWDNGSIADVGAVTWANGASGLSGVVSSANSLVGGKQYDRVGRMITPLTNGNYVVSSFEWDRGAIVDAGAATWASGTTGINGVVSSANSLVGSSDGDYVGFDMVALRNGNYVVNSANWDNGVAAPDVGAVTWGNGVTGTKGVVAAANSLIGTQSNDVVGDGGVTALPDGNYLVCSPRWSTATDMYVGALTWRDGTNSTSGVVTTANSLVGLTENDSVCNGGVVVLTNGNYLIHSFFWHEPTGLTVGAVTWVDGSTVPGGAVSSANSLVGRADGDLTYSQMFALPNGNYVVGSKRWDNGGLLDAGAVTWGNGVTGTVGVVSPANSLVGTAVIDSVGEQVVVLPNGNYVVCSANWHNGSSIRAGAATWVNGLTGAVGTVSASNSLVGVKADDSVCSGGVVVLADGDYVVRSPQWSTGGQPQVGAATWADAATGQNVTGSNVISPQNSVVGQAAATWLSTVVATSTNPTFLAVFSTEGGGKVRVGVPDPNLLTFARAEAQTLALTPAFLARTLNTGTDVTLQASSDLALNDLLSTGAGSGELTLQAGRSVRLTARLASGGAVTLLGNARASDGVRDSQRDPGPANITMQPGTTLDAGAGRVTVALRDGAGVSNAAKGSITLTSITGKLAVQGGPLTPGGIGAVGTTRVTGSLTLARDAGLTVDITGSGIGQADHVAVVGDLTIDGILVLTLGSYTPMPGATITLIDNDGSDAVRGTFTGLPQGASVTLGSTTGTISYGGGDGNDVVLTAIDAPTPTVTNTATTTMTPTATNTATATSKPATAPSTPTATRPPAPLSTTVTGSLVTPTSLPLLQGTSTPTNTATPRRLPATATHSLWLPLLTRSR